MNRKRRNFIKGSMVALCLAAAGKLDLAKAGNGDKPLFPRHKAIGTGQGIHPGRVVWMHDPEAVNWSGMDFWWKPENFDQSRILEMTRKGLMQLTGQDTPQDAWKALFEWRNAKNGKSGGYKKGQKIAIKVNMNGAGEYNDDPHGQFGVSYGNPLLLQTLLLSMTRDGGVAPEDIAIFDTCRIFPDYMQKMCAEGELKGVQFSYRNPGGTKNSRADKNAPIKWAGNISGEATYFPTVLTEADYLINLGNLKGHSWGMTLGAKNHFGIFINSERRRTPAAAGLHSNIINGKMGDYSVLADLVARKHINEKTMLLLLDGLITAPSETARISPENSVWQMEPFNGHQAASLFLSQDPVAIDSVGADFLASEPNMRKHNKNMTSKPEMENYLHEAALLARPPSGTKYTDGEGRNPGSLGTHEHWNNPEEKLYSRNLGLDEGIELIRG